LEPFQHGVLHGVIVVVAEIAIDEAKRVPGRFVQHPALVVIQ
jgi:hypothetical protein